MKLPVCIFICLIFSTVLAKAENAKTNITTASGIVYSNVVVQRVEPDGITLMTRKGMTKVPFSGLPEDLQKQYNYNPSNAVAYAQKMNAARSKYHQTAAKPETVAPTTKPAVEPQSETIDSTAGESMRTRAREGALRRRTEQLVHTTSGE